MKEAEFENNENKRKINETGATSRVAPCLARSIDHPGPSSPEGIGKSGLRPKRDAPWGHSLQRGTANKQ